MPYVTCQECGTESMAPRELVGLDWSCPKCRTPIFVGDGGPTAEGLMRARRRKANNSGPLLVIGALVLLTGAVLGFAMLVHQSRKTAQNKVEPVAKPKPGEQAEPPKKPAGEWERVSNRDVTPVDIVLGGIGLLAYFTPSAVAIFRGHANLAPILVVNIFAGWTCIGWVVALAWSVSHQSRPHGGFTAE